jgi:multiple sugar transport system permease protein
LLLSDAGKDFDYASALSSITQDANRGLMFDADRSKIERRRPLARVVFGVIMICVSIVVLIVWRKGRKDKADASLCESKQGAMRRFLPWLFLAPALASVALWSYYPLIKGAMMAFQDYKIVGGSTWAGLDNFIQVASNPGFWNAWLKTSQYVTLAILLGFTTPVILAVLLTEIPKGKVFFRMVYFLPHLTSALVIMLLWKLMFDPTENGMLNQMLALFGIARQSWLQDPSMAMTCCILPGVWAGAGMASLIYIAALGSLPPDYYEAAAIDGAGIFARLRHITIPQLMPLMVINFVGAFIAAFQGMGSIFLLTFGGPGDATNVLSLAIWKEAYNNLRFSTATTMAWFLGVALIGFSYLQIRYLRRVEFRSAAAN